MVTLAKRATPSQHRILRIIEGAVLNASDAHRLARDEQMARSIAKRATGTLTAQWPEVLAANTRPPKSGQATGSKCLACERQRHSLTHRVRRERAKLVNGAAAEKLTTAALGRPSQFNRRLPLLELWQRVKRELWHIKQSGDQAKFNAYVDLLRMIDGLHRNLVAAEETHP
jgi:hypothetical protein